VELSIFLFGLGVADYAPLIEAAEESGFAAVWLGDHLLAPGRSATRNPYGHDGRLGLDPQTPLADVWTTLAYAARSTSAISLATGVYVLPLRNVIVTARAAASLQTLSGGRLLFGVGTGWLREEFDAVGERFDDRGAWADEAIEALRLLWTGEMVSYDGRYVTVPPVIVAPGPERPIPIFGSGTSSEALARAARSCDGWFGPSTGLEQNVTARAEIESQRDRGAAVRPFTYVVRPDRPADDGTLAHYQEAGFTHLAFSLRQLGVGQRSGPDEQIEELRQAASRLGLVPRGRRVLTS
jgi:probable F420-dependent oxidoreductase